MAPLLFSFWATANAVAPAPATSQPSPAAASPPRSGDRSEGGVALPTAAPSSDAPRDGAAATGARSHGRAGEPAPLAPSQPLVLTPLQSERGQTLLFRSRHRADYGPLSQEFLTQATLTYCGVASSVMVLNSLAVPAPLASGYGPYRFWTQENLFEAGSGGPGATVVRQRGMTLAQLRALLAGRGVAAEAIEANQLTLTELRRLLRRSLADPEDRVLVNYDRRGIGQAGGGHISALAALDDSSDQVLILDVARYRYPAVWVPLAPLLQAMQRIDPDSGRSRGVVLIRRFTGAVAAGGHGAATPQPPGIAAPPRPN